MWIGNQIALDITTHAYRNCDADDEYSQQLYMDISFHWSPYLAGLAILC